MLCHGIHFRDGLVDLFNARFLLVAGGRDLGHDVRDAPHAADDLFHGAARLVHEAAAEVDLVHGVVDEDLDFLRGGGGAVGQVAHFRGDHGKAPSLLARPGRFHGRIQGQDIGLEGNAVDDTDDVGDFLRRGIDGIHGRDHFGHYLAALAGHAGGRLRHLVGLARIFAILLDGRRQFLHR